MPRGRLLTDAERAAIFAHFDNNVSVHEIARRVSRSRDAVYRAIANRNSNRKQSTNKRNTKLSPQAIRVIRKAASTTRSSAAEIKRDNNLNVSVRRVQQILHATPYLRYKQATRAPSLQPHHKRQRMEFAERLLSDDNTVWKRYVFTDEKKFNLDGPDGLSYYWHDLRKDAEVFSKRQAGEASVMVWGAITYHGPLQLATVQTTLNAEGYCSLLEDYLEEEAAVALGENWVLVQDNAPVHTANKTKIWLQEHNIVPLNWPAKSPDLNIIENVWGWLARQVYKDGKQYSCRSELARAVHHHWLQMEVQYLQTLYHSFGKRLVQVLKKKGSTISY